MGILCILQSFLSFSPPFNSFRVLVNGHWTIVGNKVTPPLPAAECEVSSIPRKITGNARNPYHSLLKHRQYLRCAKTPDACLWAYFTPPRYNIPVTILLVYPRNSVYTIAKTCSQCLTTWFGICRETQTNLRIITPRQATQ
eukprot:sb/3474207/